MHGGPGADLVIGKSTADMIYGDEDNDIIYGNGGDDYIDGGSGNDKIQGGDGNDIIFGRKGIDIISGDNGKDIIFGGEDRDYIKGGNGDDSVRGQAGSDALFGENGDDVLSGQDGNDFLHGGAGNDILYGGSGQDIIYGGAGNDKFITEAGDDIFVFTRGDGADKIRYEKTVYVAPTHDMYVFDHRSISTNDILFRRSHNNLVVKLKGSDGDQLTFEDWFLHEKLFKDNIFVVGSKVLTGSSLHGIDELLSPMDSKWKETDPETLAKIAQKSLSEFFSAGLPSKTESTYIEYIETLEQTTTEFIESVIDGDPKQWFDPHLAVDPPLHFLA